MNNKISEKERKLSHSQQHQKQDIPRNKLEEVRDLKDENCKTLMKESQEDTNGKVSHVCGSEE